MCNHMIDPMEHERLSRLLSLEIRHIEASKLTKLSAIIDKAKAWDKLLEELTKPVIRHNEVTKQPRNLKLSLEAIDLIGKQLYCGKSPTLALLNHWAITGRRRPTVWNLLGYLRICGLKWAEEYVCQAILGIDSIDQIISTHTSETVKQLRQSTFEIDAEFRFNNLETLLDQLKTACPKYSFRSIYETTNGFLPEPYKSTNLSGSMIGEGKFSSVFRAKTRREYSDDQQQVVAAKLLKSNCNEKYLANEINLIEQIKHPSILEFLGISIGAAEDGIYRYICLLYPFMENGSLLDCLSLGLPSRNMQSLTWQRRIDIALKVAQGISYLHSFRDGPIIHRDIKTANIFVDADLQPKVGDFTLVRQLDSIRLDETQYSQNVTGTSVYMPPEAFLGDISIKIDTFSFGIVLIELLTGLRPFIEDLGKDLFTFIDEKLYDIAEASEASEVGDFSPDAELTPQEAKNKFLRDILDKKAGIWEFDRAKILFEVALQAIESRKKNRPELTNLLSFLQKAQLDILKENH